MLTSLPTKRPGMYPLDSCGCIQCVHIKVVIRACSSHTSPCIYQNTNTGIKIAYLDSRSRGRISSIFGLAQDFELHTLSVSQCTLLVSQCTLLVSQCTLSVSQCSQCTLGVSIHPWCSYLFYRQCCYVCVFVLQCY